MTEREKEKKIKDAIKAGEMAGSLGHPECARPWSYYGSPTNEIGNAWERAYKEAKEKRNKECHCERSARKII